MGFVRRYILIPEQSLNRISDILLAFFLSEPEFVEIPQGVQILIAEFLGVYGQSIVLP